MPFGRKPGRGVEVSTDRGERIRRRFLDGITHTHERRLGVSCRPVLFADHRSGWSALRMSVDLWWWGWEFYPIRWRNPPRENVRYASLAEQIRETHRQELKMLTVDDEAEEQEKTDRDKLRRKEEEIMAEIRRRKDAEEHQTRTEG